MLERTRGLFVAVAVLLGSVCLCHHTSAAQEKKAAADQRTGKKAAATGKKAAATGKKASATGKKAAATGKKAAADQRAGKKAEATIGKDKKGTAGAGKTQVLISNGDFGQWADAATAPTGWTYKPSAFTIRRIEDKIQGSGFSAEQTWTKADGADSIFNLFGVDVDVRPDTTYKLSFRAKNKAGDGILVCPWDISGSAAPVRNYGLTIQVKRTPGDDFVKYEDAFNSGTATKLRFVTACTAEKLPVTAVWDDWKLVEVPAGK